MENAFLACFVALPLALGAGALVWFHQISRLERERPTAATLVGFNTLLLATLLTAALAVGEIYYRFVHDTTDAFGVTKTTDRWFERHYEFNAMGLRDSVDKYDLEIPEGKRRVTFLGDSFTAGHGVKDVELRFANRIRNDHPEWDVHVFSMNGWETAEELDAVRRMDESGYALDQVVLVYTLNDLADLVPEWQAILDGIHASLDPPFLFEHSYFLNMLYFRWQRFANADLADYYGFVRDAYAGDPWWRQRTRLVALQLAVERGGGRLAVVTFPFLHELGPGYSYHEVHEQLDAFWEEREVPHLDLLETLSKHEPDDLVVNPHDAHPNEFAHALTAREIGRLLAELTFESR